MQKKKIRCIKVLAMMAIKVAFTSILVFLVTPVSAQRNKVLSVMDVTKTMLYDGPESRKLMHGFSTNTYMENMNTLIGYVLHAEQPKTK